MKNTLALLLLIIPQVAKADFSSSVVKLNGCSAVIIAIEGEYAYGLSASHCSGAVDDTFNFTTESGKTGGGRWKKIDRSLDLALFKAFSKDCDDHTHIVRSIPNEPKFFSIAYPHDCAGKVCVGQQKTREQLGGPVLKDIQEAGTNRNFYRATFPSGKFAGGSSGGSVFVEGRDYSGVYGIITHRQSSSTNQQMLQFVDEYFAQNPSNCKDCIECRDCKKVPGPPDLFGGGKSSDQERRELIANLQNKVQTLEGKLASLEARLEALPMPLRGLPGEDGKDGRDGKNGLPGVSLPGPKGDTGEIPKEWERRLKVVEGWVSTFEKTPFWFSFTDTQGVTGKKDYYYPFDLKVKVIKQEQKVSDE